MLSESRQNRLMKLGTPLPVMHSTLNVMSSSTDVLYSIKLGR